MTTTVNQPKCTEQVQTGSRGSPTLPQLCALRECDEETIQILVGGTGTVVAVIVECATLTDVSLLWAYMSSTVSVAGWRSGKSSGS